MVADRSCLAFWRASFCASVNLRGEEVVFIRMFPFDSIVTRGKLLTLADLRLDYQLSKAWAIVVYDLLRQIAVNALFVCFLFLRCIEVSM
jgi:hypothetical protein